MTRKRTKKTTTVTTAMPRNEGDEEEEKRRRDQSESRQEHRNLYFCTVRQLGWEEQGDAIWKDEEEVEEEREPCGTERGRGKEAKGSRPLRLIMMILCTQLTIEHAASSLVVRPRSHYSLYGVYRRPEW